MNKNNNDKLNQTIDLFKKVAQNPDSVSNDDKKQIKKLIRGDKSLMIEALLSMQKEFDPDYGCDLPITRNDGRTHEEIIADNYIALAKFTIEKLHIKNAHKLKATEGDCGFVLIALTPDPVELDYEQFATSDYPNNKELLLEAEALQADLFTEDGTEQFKLEIIKRIENATL